LSRRGEGGAAAFPQKTTPALKKRQPRNAKAGSVSLIGQPAPLIVIALMLETTPEWCLADETRRAEKP
jgi:hypothetical protein